MTLPFFRFPSVRTLLGLSLSVALLGGAVPLWGTPAAQAAPGKSKSPKTTAWPARDFLPPVATINPRLDEAAYAQDDSDDLLEVVSLAGVSSPVLHASPKVERLSGSLNEQMQTGQVNSLRTIQQTVDEANLEYLWQATVERNPVIRFSLEKLATPVDLQTKQSSRFLTKTLSTLISGAALAATMAPGGGAYRDMSSMAVGNALQNMVRNRTSIPVGSLTATEQIQLASLIDELKLKLIQSYQDYRNSLQALAQAREVTLKNNDMYAKALDSRNDLAIMAAGTAYYQARMNETKLRQKTKLHRIALERLAGQEAITDLAVAIHLPTGPGTDQTASTQGPASLTTSTTASGGQDTPDTSAAVETPPAMLLGPGVQIGPDTPTQTDSAALQGPELPPAKVAAPRKKHKPARKIKPTVDLPQPLELSPTLNITDPMAPASLGEQGALPPAVSPHQPVGASSSTTSQQTLPLMLESTHQPPFPSGPADFVPDQKEASLS